VLLKIGILLMIYMLSGCGREALLHFRPKYQYPMGAMIHVEYDDIPQDPLDPIIINSSSLLP
jgi:hypothetical protein